jgi:hypothetical protein
MAGQGPANSTEYITHHLTHLKVGEGFWTWHVDTIFMSVLTGILALGLFYAAARKATSGVPGKGQAFVEMVVEFVDTQVKEIFHLDRRFLAPLALTIFLWVFFMNAMDLLPLDVPGVIAGWFGLHYWRVVPTADLNTTFDKLTAALEKLFNQLANGLPASAATGARGANDALSSIEPPDFRYGGSGEDATGYVRGGLVYAARGLYIPRGTDTVPAMLSPGEFVMSAAATRRLGAGIPKRRIKPGDVFKQPRGKLHRARVF